MREAMPQTQSATADRLWSVADLALFLGLRPKTVYGWVECGRIPHFKLGGRVRFDPAEIERWLKSQRGGV